MRTSTSFVSQVVHATVLCAITVLSTASGQMGESSTKTSLELNRLNSNGTLLQAVAHVRVSGIPVPAGEVAFSIDGAPAQLVQIIRSGAAGYQLGDAVLTRSLGTGSHTVRAHYLGTSAFKESQSAPVSFNLDVSGLGEQEGHPKRASPQHESTNLNSIAELSVKMKVPMPIASSGEIESTLTVGELKIPFRASAVKIADLLHLGHEDLVLADPAEASVLVYMQQANGDYGTPVVLRVGIQPVALEVADLNGDGLPDIVVANAGDSSVSVLLQDASRPGSFNASENIMVGSVPSALAIGDFNGDGLPDLAVANFGDDSLSILTNSDVGERRLRVAAVIPTGSGPSSLAVGHFVSRQSTDLAVTAFYDGTVSIFANQPSSEQLLSLPAAVFHTGRGPTALAATDLNGDGLTDLAACNSVDGTVSVLLTSKGRAGDFSNEWVIDGFQSPSGITALFKGTAQSVADLLISDSATGQVTTLQNNGSGAFKSRTTAGLGQSLSLIASGYPSYGKGSKVVAFDSATNTLEIVGTVPSSDQPAAALIPNQAASDQAQRIQVAPLARDVQSSSPERSVEANSLAAQQITFPGLLSVVYGSGPIQLTATATSGLPVQYTIKRGNGTIVGNTMTVNSAGLFLIEADQLGDVHTAPAEPVTRPLYVAKAPLKVTPDAAERLFGSANPAFIGSVEGLKGTDSVQFIFSSSASRITPPEVYNTSPFGISATLVPSVAADNYSVLASVGKLTICPQSAGSSIPLCETLPSQTSPETTSGNSTSSAASNGLSSGQGAAPSQTSTTPPAGDPTIANTVATTVPTVTDGSQSTSSVASSDGSSVATIPVVVPSTSGSGQSASSISSTVLSGGLKPVGGPKLPFSPGPTKLGGSINPSGDVPPTKPPATNSPVVTPAGKKPHQSESALLPVVVPMPLPSPSTVLPLLSSLLPHVSLNFGAGRHEKAATMGDHSGLLIFEDGRYPTLPDWPMITVVSECPASATGVNRVLISQGSLVIAELNAELHTEVHSRVHIDGRHGLMVRASSVGGKSCPSAVSDTIQVLGTDRALPSAVIEDDDLLEEQPYVEAPQAFIAVPDLGGATRRNDGDD